MLRKSGLPPTYPMREPLFPVVVNFDYECHWIRTHLGNE